ncbi:hypothetical protein DTO021D3_5902 [Paecilomyces variotii]|nr:hypothetical protein DTO032I3_5019 [Paecilomyces variotii]KAJ9277215.1 hypothetical protein DTO021D3_5902 [Paecilomyces variotii]KAJ9339216.1 hypothetical protein DTO027B6_8278 [Paecilomyces variotii]KAJ9382539.1 hypothetical protein DTO032I4_5548 [Paecilomyces variotii]
MSPRPALFTATRLQTATYLLAVCLFSIAFLVFVNASISFVVTDLIGRHHGVGDAVGTLGFADELLALVACPAWGMLSDRIGVRWVCTTGYAIVALSLFVFVQAKNVYPQLLLGRLLFSVGGAAVATMVTATLPSVSGGSATWSAGRQPTGPGCRTSMSSELTVTPVRYVRSTSRDGEVRIEGKPSSSRLAGFVGMFTGCGALVALMLFLPLPARFEKMGLSPPEAIQRSYYVVGSIALLVSLVCFIGLRNLHGDEGKGWRSLGWTYGSYSEDGVQDGERSSAVHTRPLSYFNQLSSAFILGFRHTNITLGYLGGFVARASSVGISLFVPLFVNHYYRESGLCREDPSVLSEPDMGDIKKSCPKAYILASILTGVSQLIALICAPAFGFLSEKSRNYNLPLLFAACAGVIGYVAFALLPSPRYDGPQGNLAVFLVMALIGISQIGAIVCSLGVLSNGVLHIDSRQAFQDRSGSEAERAPGNGSTSSGPDRVPNEEEPLLGKPSERQSQDLQHLKGSIAGMYSLYGGAGILILTKLGGLLFDVLSPGAPFYILAAFNGFLLVAGMVCGVATVRSSGLKPQA